MMKASELRIGNYIYYHGTNGPTHNVNKIDGTDINIMEYKKSYLNLHSPIPLTEQWLLDFGLERAPQPNGTIFYGSRSVFCRIIGHSYKDTFLLFGYEFPVELEYVHQLQNLYFVLTSKELTK